WAFLGRAGTLILASMIVVWALLYFPYTNPAGESYDLLIALKQKGIENESRELEQLTKEIEKPLEQWEGLKEEEEKAAETDKASLRARLEELEAAIKPTKDRLEELEAKVNPVQEEINKLQAEWTGESLLGRMGHRLEPVFVPLGWDWRIGMAALASFPAREVIVGTLGIIYQTGKVDTDEIREAKKPGETRLAQALKEATWDHDAGGKKAADKIFTIPVALSLMVFFALCCQCASTL